LNSRFDTLGFGGLLSLDFGDWLGYIAVVSSSYAADRNRAFASISVFRGLLSVVDPEELNKRLYGFQSPSDFPFDTA
jgi:hypothetical protein